MNVNLNPRQKLFLSKLMKPTSGFLSPNSPVYWEFVLKMLNEQYLNPNALTTSKTREMMFSIVEKIQYAYLDEELDTILTQVEELPSDELPESTKAQSFKKVTSFSERHQQIIEVLSRYPEGLSRNDISERTNIRLCSVTARVKELLDQKLIRVCGTKYDEKTGRVVQVLGLI